ncbi:transglycosylase SLT domain-containing protein [Oceaniglobus indicus]|uniref:transglycosylase SLT domain-containing protein n=1 Tax=Oceaniglobus indicus TaxID=2047749 RepID=UPI000C18B87F|nr:transglycosylase SLT domain-containing protein [Oceaniglobus indicus]
MVPRRRLAYHFGLAALIAALAVAPIRAEVRPKPRPPGLVDVIPETQWDHHGRGAAWTRAALAALKSHGAPLADTVPGDIGQWCPGYATGDAAQRRAFWVGFLSALAKYESRWRPGAVGGGGRWFGLLQILPATARGYGCRARSGAALKTGADNLSCAIRIMARTVRRDGVIHARTPRWSGVAADWGPMRSDRKRAEMAEWLRSQSYCQRMTSPRPKARPALRASGNTAEASAIARIRPVHPERRQVLPPSPPPGRDFAASDRL